VTTAEIQLRAWFSYLSEFQACCAQSNGNAAALSLQAFSSAKPSAYLPDAATQNQFAVCSSDRTQIQVEQADVSSAASFVGLLGATFGVVNGYLAVYLESESPAPFDAMPVGDFQMQKTSAVYLGGASNAAWKATDAGLAKIIDPSCYSAAQRAKVAAIVGDGTKLISDVVNQIACFG
jgi:hypothetical protein